MIDEVDIIEKLRKRFSWKRYEHTMSVRAVALKLARRYKADERKVSLAALLHDAGRRFDTEEEMVRYLRWHWFKVPERRARSKGLLHAKVSYCIARDEFKIKDKQVLNAILRHTTGAAPMSLIDKIIYIADFLDPNREHPFTKSLTKLAFKDLNEALLKTAALSLEYDIENRRFISRESIDFFNSLVS